MIQGGDCLTQLARVSLESTSFNAPHMLLCYIMIIILIWQLMAVEKFPFVFLSRLIGCFNIVKVNSSQNACLSLSSEAFGTPEQKVQLY